MPLEDTSGLDATQLLHLSSELILSVFQHLGPVSLARIACTCKRLCELANDDDLWSSICSDRWHVVHQTGLTKTPGPFFRHAYTQCNGWQAPRLNCTTISAPPGDFLSAVHVCALANSPCNHVALANGNEVQLWQIQSSETDTLSQSLVGTYEIPRGAMIYSMTMPSPDVLITGNNWGALEILHLHTDRRKLEKRASIRSISVPAVSICHLGSSSRVVSLHDATFSPAAPAGQRNVLRVADLDTQKEMQQISEHLESYEYIAMEKLSGMAAAGEQLVAGAVHGAFCRDCYDAGVPSLCWHKGQAHTAVLSVFDFRAPSSMVQRYSTHHRSLYPHIASSRQHYVFTSHAGTALCVWDLRSMSAPLYEQTQHLSHTAVPAAGGPAWALPPARQPATCQAVWLDTDDDVLLGRADNGMMWLWDLSTTLGWAQPSSRHAPAQQGSWRQLLEQPQLAEEGGMAAGQLGPAPLGALSCGDSLAEVQLGRGPACHLACLCSGAEQGQAGEGEHVRVMKLVV